MEPEKVNFYNRLGIQTWGLQNTDNQVSTLAHTALEAANQNAELMVINKTFTKQADLLLNNMLRSIGFTKNNTHITKETPICNNHIENEINYIKPKLLLALGKDIANCLLNTNSSLNELRGNIHNFNNIPVVVTYDLADLLLNPKDKSHAFKDLLLVNDSNIDI